MARSVGFAFLTVLILALPEIASAQSSARWTGLFAGVDLATSFGVPDFTVDFDATPGHSGGLADGRVKPGVTFGARFGFNRQFAEHFVLGGEVGFGKLGYHGEANFGNWFGETEGGAYWSALARAGYGLGVVMPYVGFGAMGAKNTAHVLRCTSSDCSTIIADGSNTVSVTRPIVTVGAEFAPGRTSQGFTWSFRIEWLHLGTREVVNSFVETLQSGAPGFPVEVTSRSPAGMLRVLVDFMIKR